MLSHAKYPYMSRFYRRHPECYAGDRWPAVRGVNAYPLLLALLARLGNRANSCRAAAPYVPHRERSCVPVEKTRWQRIKEACSNAWQWVKGKVGC